jgi:hypothetical protein
MKVPKHNWTDDQLNCLIQTYPKYASKIVKEKYPFLSLRQIHSKAESLFLQNKWTVKEIITLRMNYGKIPNSELAAKIPNRTWGSIRHKANSLGFCTDHGKNKFKKKYHTWTQEEIEAVKQHYSTKGNEYIKSLFPHLTKTAIGLKARSLGLHAPASGWTTEEKEIVKNNYHLGYEHVMELLPGRTKYAIMTLAVKLRCTRRKKRSYVYLPTLDQIAKRKMEIRQEKEGYLTEEEIEDMADNY